MYKNLVPAQSFWSNNFQGWMLTVALFNIVRKCSSRIAAQISEDGRNVQRLLLVRSHDIPEGTLENIDETRIRYSWTIFH